MAVTTLDVLVVDVDVRVSLLGATLASTEIASTSGSLARSARSFAVTRAVSAWTIPWVATTRFPRAAK